MSALKKYAAKHELELPDDKPKRVATVAIKHGNHVLMGKRRDNGKWTAPGGHLEGDEDFHQGALREVKEESGIDLEPHQIEALAEPEEVTKPNGEKLHVQGFLANVDKRPATSMTDDPDAEVHRWQWVDVSKGLPDHIQKDLHVPIHQNVLRSALGCEGEDGMMDNSKKCGPALSKYMKRKGMKEEDYTADKAVDHEMSDKGPAEEEDEEHMRDQRAGRGKGGGGHRGGF